MKRLMNSFKYAFNGFMSLYKTGGNIRIHFTAALVVIALAYAYKVSAIEWTVLLICIGVVISAEAMNTSLEKLTDMVSPDFNKEAGKIKDIAAGAVLILAIMAAIIAIIIFYPYCCG
ncbi:MAG TPA: diacylglycerol kinase family protein [Bacteroidia bacterium]|nr:diacylglycerol kinase family protein [Bacteroidia bacterium]HQF27404.1 diacylglycerol kinase family protein [Bacteroidia bacterium]HQK96783.1 diacylglycerol kinase family protein [Bacteroidia bacterium]